MNVCDDVQIKYDGDGIRVLFPFEFTYEAQSDVKVGFLDDTTNEYVEVAKDDANHPWSFDNDTTIRFAAAPSSTDKIKIYRVTEINYAVFSAGSSIRAKDLNDNFDQLELAIEEGRCADEDIRDYVDKTYWNKLEDTLEAGDTWVSDDDHIATTQRGDERWLKKAGDGSDIVTEAQQKAGTVVPNDTSVFSTAASAERHDQILSTTNPGDPDEIFQPGKLWIQTADERIQYWNDTIEAWVDTSQSGPQGPVGPQGPSGTVTVGDTTTSAPGGDAQVTNSGTATDAVLNFTIPRGEQGPPGDEGPQGPAGAGVTFQGQLDATLPNSAPADPAVGDVWLNETAGTIDASWAGAGGQAADVGWRLIFNAQGTWTLAPPSVSDQLWELNAQGNVTTVVDRDVYIPDDLLLGGTDAAPRLTFRGDNVQVGTGVNSPAGGSIGFVTNDTQRAVVNDDGLTVGPSIELQGTNETIVVGNMRIDSNQINHNGQWTIDINNNDLMVFRDNDITTIEDLDVEGTAAPGFSLTTTTGVVYRIDSINAGDEAWWTSVGAPNPQVGAYFTATADTNVPANNEITRILQTADLHVSGNTSIGGGLTVNNITFPDGSVIMTGGGGATISATPPNPGEEVEGQLWWNSDDGRLYIWYIDPNADAQWVDASPDGGQFTTGPVAPQDPNEGDVWIDTSQCPPVLFIWSDCSGTGEWGRDGGALIAPVLGAAVLANSDTGTGRFNDETFNLTMPLNTPGQPAATVGVRAVIEPENNLRIVTRPTTDDITQVDTVQYAGGFNIVDVNDNGWYDITWFGPPWNFYFAYSTSGSGVGQAKSYDGITWELISTGIFPTTNCRPVYVEKYQRVYWVNRGYSVYWTDDPDLQTYTEAINFGGNSPNAEARINQLAYLPEQDFFVAYREFWTAPNIMRSAVNDGDLSTGWRTQGTVQGYCNGGTIVKPGTNQAMVIMKSYGPANENYQQTVWTNDITASSISWSNPLNGQTAGVNTSPGGYYDTVADRWVLACNYPVAGLVSWDGNTTPTTSNATVTDIGVNFTRMEWIEDSGFAIGTGGSTQEDNGKIWIITDGGRQVQEIVTSVPYVNWSDVNCENGLFLFCASAGNDPGMRFAYSTTVGQTQDAPRLLLASNFGLDSFSVGQEVEQSDGNASGLVGEISVDNQTMTIANSTGTWAVGEQVVGPASDFTKAWAVLDADGNVTGLSPSETPYTTLNGSSPYTINFPATFGDGTTPDQNIPAGNGIRIQGRALSEQDDFTAESRSTSNLVVPE